MTSQQKNKVELTFGSSIPFDYEMDEDSEFLIYSGLSSVDDEEKQIASALANPLDFPTLDQAVVPDDQIVIALEPNLHCADIIVSQIWSILKTREISPGQITVLQPEVTGKPIDPRRLLPVEIRSVMHWKIHNSTVKDSCCYLATTMSGERIDLAESLVDADFVITVGTITYDSVLGVQGTSTVLFPGLSNKEAYQKTTGQGHDELGPRNIRPIRQFIDEIGWLLGTQFTIQFIPGNDQGFSHVLSGLVESVQREGEKILSQHWQVNVESRPETVVASIDLNSTECSWKHLASAIASARRIVSKDGKIIILTEMNCQPGDAMELLRSSDSPEEMNSLLKQTGSLDAQAAIEISNATDWANIYLLSQMDCDLVEDLLMTPLDDQEQVKRLLSDSGSTVFIQSAQHTYASVGS